MTDRPNYEREKERYRREHSREGGSKQHACHYYSYELNDAIMGATLHWYTLKGIDKWRDMGRKRHALPLVRHPSRLAICLLLPWAFRPLSG